MTFTVPSRSYDAGETPFGPFSVPNGASSAVMRLARSSWPVVAATVENPHGNLLALRIEWCPQNNGSDWRFLGSFTAEGGDSIDRLGNVRTESMAAFTLPQPENNQRRVRLFLNAGATFTTTVTVDVN